MVKFFKTKSEKRKIKKNGFGLWQGTFSYPCIHTLAIKRIQQTKQGTVCEEIEKDEEEKDE